MLKTIDLRNGETLGYRKSGEGGKVIVLVHGNMSSSIHWDTVMSGLPNDYTAYAVDLRGFGASSYNRRISSLKELSEDLKLFVDELGLNKFALVGWSTGGGIVMHFAIDYPNLVDKLILVESVGIKGYPMLKKDGKGQPLLGEFLKTKEEIEADPIQVKPILDAYKTKNKEFIKLVWDSAIYTFKKPEEERYDSYLDEILKQRNLVDIDYALVHFNISNEHNGVVQGSGEISKLKAPTLVIQGEDDLVVPKAMGVEIAETMGKIARLELLPNGGHAPIEDNLDRFMNLIIDFLE
ncbi:MAG: alpha/beta hydrolase [Eubacteriales bacterium]|nr:alpha/beta hydrolase [Eubacteriales bacterium]